MCLLTFIMPGADLPHVKAVEAAAANPDGFGFAIHANNKIHIDKDMDFDELWKRWKSARQKYAGAALWHFRFATHGETDLFNCHPFIVPSDSATVLAHNGILPMPVPHLSRDSDTKLFAELVFPTFGGVEALDDAVAVGDLEAWAGHNKLVVLTTNPKAEHNWYIVNEQLGHWRDGVWFSNYSYIPYRFIMPTRRGPKYSGWNDGSGITTPSTPTNPYMDDWYPEGATELVCEDAEASHRMSAVQREYFSAHYTDDVVDFLESYLEFLEDYMIATCYECGEVYWTQYQNEIPTHCGVCNVCLACGQGAVGDGCDCWDDYAVDISYYANKSIDGFSHVVEITDHPSDDRLAYDHQF